MERFGTEVKPVVAETESKVIERERRFAAVIIDDDIKLNWSKNGADTRGISGNACGPELVKI